jgi:HSP20 family protein
VERFCRSPFAAGLPTARHSTEENAMAKQDVKSNEQQNQMSQGQSPARNQGRSLTRGYDPFGLSLLPGDFFRSSPFSIFRRMSDEMERMLGEYGVHRGEGKGAWSPAIEVSHQNDKFLVRAELPGLKPEDVKLEITDEAITMEGERREEHEETQGGRHMTERRYGQFYRSIPLPEGANGEQARARFDNGVLEISVPVQEQANKRRPIPIDRT